MTKRNYLSAVTSYVRFAGADPAGWTGYSVEAWRNQLPVSPRSRNTKLLGLKYASKRQAALGWGPDFAAGVESLSAPLETHRRPHSPEEAARLIGACKDGTPAGLRDTAILVIGFRTGLRREGLSNLRFEDLGPGRRMRVVLKGGRRHEIRALDDEVMVAIAAWTSWLDGHGIRGNITADQAPNPVQLVV